MFAALKKIFKRAPKKFVLLRYTNGKVKEARVIDETQTCYLIRSTTGVYGISWEEDRWTSKINPVIVDIYER